MTLFSRLIKGKLSFEAESALAAAAEPSMKVQDAANSSAGHDDDLL